MTPLEHVPDDLELLYEFQEWRHATAILATDFPAEWAEIVDVLRGFRLKRSDVAAKGGRKSPVAT